MAKISLLLILTTLIYGIICDPRVKPADSTSPSSSSDTDSTASASNDAPPVVVPAPGLGIPGVGAGAGAGFHKGFDFNAGAGLGGLAGLIPGLGSYFPGAFAGADPSAEIPPLFLGPQYIPQSFVGSALAAKGDLLFPIMIFIFVVIGVIATIKLLLALLIPLIAKKAALKSKFFRSTTSAAADDEQEQVFNSKAAQQKVVNEVTQKVLRAIDCGYDSECEFDD